MSNVFSNLTNDGLEDTGDSLGGRIVLDSNVYTATVKAAYAIESQGGALGINLQLLTNEGDYNEVIYVTNRDKQNFYINQNKKKCPLPGFTLINDLCMLNTKKPLSSQNVENKVLKVWDFESKKEVTKELPVLNDLTGTKINVCILKQKVNKRVKEGDRYVESADTISENRINKFLDLTNKTVHEIKDNKESSFYDKWISKYKGVEVDKSKAIPGSATTSVNQTPRKSLFQ